MRRLKFISVALLVSSVVAHAASSERSPRFLVHLLDYLAKDYGGAVAHGKVLNESEYHEQIEFSRSALETNQGLYETRATPEIATKLKALNQLIATKSDAASVSRLAREIQAQVIQVARLEVAPVRWPSLQRGKQVFVQNCVACHGATGMGDGLAGKNLDPKPANFLDDHMKEVSPFQAFNTIRLGVPGTGMPPFHSLSDKEAWDVAFYVVSLRHGQALLGAKQVQEREGITLKQVATLSDEKIEESLPAKHAEDRAQVIASLRTRSDDDDSGGGSLTVARTQLDEAMKDYEAGRVDSAKTKALKAYLEGI